MTLGLRPSVVQRRAPFLFDWDGIAGWDRLNRPVTVDGLQGTFTRAGTKTAVGANGRVYTVPYGVPAHHHIYSGGIWTPVGVLLERAGANLCQYSEDHSGAAWSAVGTPTRTPLAKYCGVVSMELIGDDAGGALEGYTQPITFTGDGTHPYTVYVSQGSSTSAVFRIRDTSASADRLLAAITWSGGLPVVTTSAGSKITPDYERLVDLDGNPVFRILLVATSVVAANTNQLEVYPATDAALATSATGTIYVGGHMAEDDATAPKRPSSYVPRLTNAAASRVVDALTFPALWLPRDLTIYADFYEFASFQASGVRALQLGDDDSGTASSVIVECPGIGDVQIHPYNATSNQSTSVTTGAVARHDRHQVRAVALAAGAYIGRSINGAAESVSSPATALAHPNSYAEALICPTPNTFSAHTVSRLRVAVGDRTLAHMVAGL